MIAEINVLTYEKSSATRIGWINAVRKTMTRHPVIRTLCVWFLWQGLSTEASLG